jgi:hypothetical protein
VATYTYLSTDMLTGSVNGELRLTGVDAVASVTGTGTFQAYMPSGDAKYLLDDPQYTRSSPRRTCLCIDRDGTIVWAGIIWTRKYDSQSKMFTLGGNELLSYFDHRYIKDQKVYAAADQLAMAVDLVNYAQSKPSGNIGIIVPSPVPTSGVLRTATFQPWDRASIGTVLSQYAAMNNGFDIRVSVAYEGTPGFPVRRLQLMYPRAGTPSSLSNLVFEYGSAITRYTWPEDGSAGGNDWLGSGAGSQSKQLLSEEPSIPAGEPLLENVISDITITDQQALNDLTTSMLNEAQLGTLIPTVYVDPAHDPVLGSYWPGDEARFIIDDNRFPSQTETPDGVTHALNQQYDAALRIVEIEIIPTGTDPSGSSPEQAVLTLGPPLNL